VSRARIEPAGPAFAAVLAEIHAAAYADPTVSGAPWPEPAWHSLLANPGAVCLLASTAERPAGLVLARVAADEAEILTIGVMPAARRQGLAGRLLEQAAAACVSRGAARLFLEVAETNMAARALYTASGFVQVGRRARYYRLGGQDIAALVMARPLA
jgi:ribosomal-protein-alanine N-acetyltransferase